MWRWLSPLKRLRQGISVLGHAVGLEDRGGFGRPTPKPYYTTLSRLERDGLVRSQEVEQASRPTKRVYELTPEGRAALEQWVQDASSGPKVKDEFFLKLVLAQVADVEDPLVLIERQRQRYLQDMRDLENLAMRRRDGANPVAQLLIEGATLHLQADLKWLDLCEDYFNNGGV